MKKLLVLIGIIFFVFPVFACETNEIDLLGDGTQCETAKFTLSTTNLSSGTEFKFNMSAAGTFYVDCGNGGTLNSDNNDDWNDNHYYVLCDDTMCPIEEKNSRSEDQPKIQKPFKRTV